MENGRYEKSARRVQYVDAVRGFGILLVIVGHLIQYNFSSGLNNPIFNIIYSFHMPLFFFLAGYVDSFKKKTDLKLKEILGNIGRRFTALIVPSIVWGCFSPLFFSSKLFINYGINTYWFLNILFVVYLIYSILFYSISKFDSKLLKKMIFIIFFVAIIVLFIMNFKRIPLMYTCMYGFGYIFCKYDIQKLMTSKVSAIMIFVFLLVVGFFKYGNTTAGDPNRVYLMFLLSMLSIPVIIKMFEYIENFAIVKLMSSIGKYTLGIYLVHFYLIEMKYLCNIEVVFTPLMQFFLLLIISVFIAIICIMLQKIVEPFPYVSLLLYGRKCKKR